MMSAQRAVSFSSCCSEHCSSRAGASPCTQVLSLSPCPPQLPLLRHQHEMLSPRCPHLVLLLEAIAFCRLHLVNMLEEICHPHSGMKLPSVIGGPFAATLAAGGTSQQAAGLVDHTAALVACRRGGRTGGLSGDQKLRTMSPITSSQPQRDERTPGSILGRCWCCSWSLPGDHKQPRPSLHSQQLFLHHKAANAHYTLLGQKQIS